MPVPLVVRAFQGKVGVGRAGLENRVAADDDQVGEAGVVAAGDHVVWVSEVWVGGGGVGIFGLLVGGGCVCWGWGGCCGGCGIGWCARSGFRLW